MPNTASPAPTRPALKTLPCMLALAFGVPLQPALAQDAKPAEPAAVGILQPVSVTAERRIENIKDVPSAITTLSGETLDVLNSGGQDVRMLSGRVPA